MFEYQEKPSATPRLVQYFNKLGYDWEKVGRKKEACRYYKKALMMCEQVYGQEHRLTRSLSAKVGSLRMQL